MYIKEIRREGVEWIHLAQDSNLWQDLMNMVMTFGFHGILGICTIDNELLTSQDGLCCM
jgi:hypothetical protein